MKEHVDRLFGKLRSSKGETLAELLVSVLVIVLGTYHVLANGK